MGSTGTLLLRGLVLRFRVSRVIFLCGKALWSFAREFLNSGCTTSSIILRYDVNCQHLLGDHRDFHAGPWQPLMQFSFLSDITSVCPEGAWSGACQRAVPTFRFLSVLETTCI